MLSGVHFDLLLLKRLNLVLSASVRAFLSESVRLLMCQCHQ